MDDAWKFFRANKTEVLPILRKELSAEMRQPRPNPLVLLDIGYFIRLQDAPADKELGRQAFFAVDGYAEIVRWNSQQFFNYAHAVAPDRDARTLAYLDRHFLRGTVTAVVPQHALTLDETLVCVFVYGAYGEGAERHLRTQLTDRAAVQRIIEVLVWIGSPESVPEVNAAMLASRDYGAFTRATAFMMTAGGPAGRAALLAAPIRDFDARTQEYYARVRRPIEATTYESLREQFTRFPDSGPLTDAELKQRLEAMYRTYGSDERTRPQSILASGLPKDYLIAELTRIRSRMLQRVSDEALSDVRVTNAVLNALYYKP
ncbi:MAG: hypothetical protein OEV81_13590 [Betaproteobacteria bacterium]|nr:hypothetical protein [Betaproteobacteria bacterium]MDH5221527.1 hypothetical protein [Betaproteobacteria bacterium]MDH5349462.1 hypothetical protein [Betaproteobacteria bacterium]